jgi:tRNA(fMet)-specific endonuclease VapC
LRPSTRDASGSIRVTGKLLDTNVVVALLAGEEATRARFAGAGPSFLPSVVLGELVFGAHKSTRVKENLARIDAFVRDVPVIPSDADVARRYGETKAKLREKGRPIPENDIWIAAIGLHHQLTLVTRDEHFRNVDGLMLERW